jgi:hypothetical protein
MIWKVEGGGKTKEEKGKEGCGEARGRPHP